MKSLNLRNVLRLVAALVLLGAAITWVSTGSHRGWSQTQITEMQRDEITGIDYPVQHDGFIAGLDVLAGGAGLAAALAGLSLFVGRRQSAA